jgi:hypothetical protein
MVYFDPYKNFMLTILVIAIFQNIKNSLIIILKILNFE